MTQNIVFTDLDGTLLDTYDYSYAPALPALRMLRERDIPLVFCSSKTGMEIEFYRRRIENRDPFISENGGGIFLPEGYFDQSRLPNGHAIVKTSSYTVIHLGTPYPLLRQTLQELRREGFALTGFGDMSVEAVAELTGLPEEQAAMAKVRDFDEPFTFAGDAAEVAELAKRIRTKGLHLTKGAFFHLLGDSNKGVAVAVLADLFRQKFGNISVIALGDAPNDLPMLQQADHPVAIRKPDGHHDPVLALPGVSKTRGIGPVGWNEAILELLRERG